MKFKLEFDMDNAAFDEFPRFEIKRILEQTSTDIYLVSLKEGNNIKDSNGNTIGKWWVE